MAKRRTAGAQIVRAFPVARPAPIIIRQTRQARAPKKKRHHRRRSGSSSGVRPILAVGMGGALFGFIEKQFPNLPTLPILGRAGTVAIAGHYIGKHVGGTLGGIIRDASIAAAAIAGYELGKDGRISGDDDLHGDIPSQVRGVASQV